MGKADKRIRLRSLVTSVAGVDDGLEKYIAQYIANEVQPGYFNQLELVHNNRVSAGQLARLMTLQCYRLICAVARNLTKEEAMKTKIGNCFNNVDKDVNVTGTSLRDKVCQVVKHLLQSALPHLLGKGEQFDATIVQGLRRLQRTTANMDDDALVLAVVAEGMHRAESEDVAEALQNEADVVLEEVTAQWEAVAIATLTEEQAAIKLRAERLREVLVEAYGPQADQMLQGLQDGGLQAAAAAGYVAAAPAQPPAPAPVEGAVPPATSTSTAAAGEHTAGTAAAPGPVAVGREATESASMTGSAPLSEEAGNHAPEPNGSGLEAPPAAAAAAAAAVAAAGPDGSAPLPPAPVPLAPAPLAAAAGLAVPAADLGAMVGTEPQQQAHAQPLLQARQMSDTDSDEELVDNRRAETLSLGAQLLPGTKRTRGLDAAEIDELEPPSIRPRNETYIMAGHVTPVAGAPGMQEAGEYALRYGANIKQGYTFFLADPDEGAVLSADTPSSVGTSGLEPDLRAFHVQQAAASAGPNSPAANPTHPTCNPPAADMHGLAMVLAQTFEDIEAGKCDAALGFNKLSTTLAPALPAADAPASGPAAPGTGDAALPPATRLAQAAATSSPAQLGAANNIAAADGKAWQPLAGPTGAQTAAAYAPSPVGAHNPPGLAAGAHGPGVVGSHTIAMRTGAQSPLFHASLAMFGGNLGVPTPAGVAVPDPGHGKQHPPHQFHPGPLPKARPGRTTRKGAPDRRQPRGN